MNTTLSGDARADSQLFQNTARLYSYWDELPFAPMPSWTDVNLMDVYEIAPLIFVADVIRSGSAPKFVYRFVGTKIVELFQYDATGMSVEDAFEDERRALILEAYSFVVNSNSPQLGIRAQATRGRDFVQGAVLTLPLFDAEGDVNMLLGINDLLYKET